jgi:hypothetical protein
MKTDHQDAAKRRLLTICSRRFLERLTRHPNPKSLRRSQLINECVRDWDAVKVAEEIERRLAVAGPTEPHVLQRMRRDERAAKAASHKSLVDFVKGFRCPLDRF